VEVDGRQALARTVATVADPVDAHDTVQFGYTVSQSAGELWMYAVSLVGSASGS